MADQKDFYFYSTERGASLTPEELDPAPATLIKLDQPPILGDGQFNEQAGSVGRGSVLQTFGGNVIQDFGVVASDERLFLSESDALTQETIDALKTIHETVDGQYYFTDGFSAWKVQFLRPNGFKYRKNLLWAQPRYNYIIYSYEITLIIISKDL